MFLANLATSVKPQSYGAYETNTFTDLKPDYFNPVSVEKLVPLLLGAPADQVHPKILEYAKSVWTGKSPTLAQCDKLQELMASYHASRLVKAILISIRLELEEKSSKKFAKE